MNPYPYPHSYDYIVQMNGTPYQVKMEEPDCYPQNDRELSAPSPPVLPYMNTFTKHAGPSMAMLYPQLTYDIPLLLNQRRRSANQDPLEINEESPYPHNLPGLKEKFKKASPRSPGNAAKRRSEDEPQQQQQQPPPPFQLMANHDGLDGQEASDFSAKSRKLFCCRQCGKNFKFQTSLLRHNNKMHISKYQCPTCSRVFSRQAYLDVHTSKQGSSCYLDPAMRISRGRQQIPTQLSTTGTD